MPLRLELLHWSTAMVLGISVALVLTTALRRYRVGGLWFAAGILSGLVALVAALRPHSSWEPWYDWRVLTWRYAEWSVSSQLGAILMGLLIAAVIVQVLDRSGRSPRVAFLAACISSVLAFALQLITRA